MEAGDLFLMDAGCEMHGYVSDVTRTWPGAPGTAQLRSHAQIAPRPVQEPLCSPANRIVDRSMQRCCGLYCSAAAVSGKFSGAQRDLYGHVLEAHTECLKARTRPPAPHG